VATFDRMFDDNADRIKSLYLWSESPGTGKTTTAIAFLNEWMIAHYLGSHCVGIGKRASPAVFLDVNSFQTELQSRHNDERRFGNGENQGDHSADTDGTFRRA
jgi:KaiC/GvpD/RAD55 family RecA-like ATPase